MGKIHISEGTLYLPPAITGKKLQRFLDMNGLNFITPREVVRLRSHTSNRIHKNLLHKEIEEYVQSTKKENELFYSIID